MANPYGGPPGRVSLAPDEVAGIVFWTKNAGLPEGFAAVQTAGLPFTVQY